MNESVKLVLSEDGFLRTPPRNLQELLVQCCCFSVCKEGKFTVQVASLNCTFQITLQKYLQMLNNFVFTSTSLVTYPMDKMILKLEGINRK